MRESAQRRRKALGWIMQLLPSSLKEDTLRSLPAKRVLYKVRGGLSSWHRSARVSGSPGLTPQRDALHACLIRAPYTWALHAGHCAHHSHLPPRTAARGTGACAHRMRACMPTRTHNTQARFDDVSASDLVR